MTNRTKVLIGIITAAFIGLFLMLNHKRDAQIVSPILGPGIREKIIIDSLHRRLTIVTAKGSDTLSLPDRPSSIEISNEGTVKVIAPQFGYEHTPFIGIGYSKQLNDYIGMDFYYWKSLDLGAAISFDRNFKVKALDMPVVLSYTVYHRLRISVGVEPFGEHSIHGLLSVRI